MTRGPPPREVGPDPRRGVDAARRHGRSDPTDVGQTFRVVGGVLRVIPVGDRLLGVPPAFGPETDRRLATLVVAAELLAMLIDAPSYWARSAPGPRPLEAAPLG